MLLKYYAVFYSPSKSSISLDGLQLIRELTFFYGAPSAFCPTFSECVPQGRLCHWDEQARLQGIQHFPTHNLI